jgi:hypothetical protein
MSAERWCLLSLLATTGCGSLVGGDYRGEVLMEIQGAVLMQGDLSFDDDIGVALLWTNDDQAAVGAQSVVVQTAFPARYTIQIHSEPREGTRLSLLGVDAFDASIGQIVLYQDLDGDGTWAGPGREPVVGGAFDTAVVWIPPVRTEANGQEAAPPDVVDFGEFLPTIENWQPRTGFQLVEVSRPPVCGIPLSDIFFERTDNRATLHVGGLRNAYFDWDCDGFGDYDLGAQPTEPGSPDAPPDGPTWDDGFGIETCPPEDILQLECENLAYLLQDPDVTGDPGFLVELETFYEDWWLECMEPQCYEVVEAYRVASEQPSTTFEP